jgi:two-component system sensor histidine kinase HydH
MAWLIGWGRDVSLTRQFGLLSLVVVGLITTTFCLVISHSLRQDLLEREWSTTADFIRTEAIHNLTPSDFADPEHTASQARFLEFYLRTVVMPEIVRVKIYDAGKRVVWSDEPRLLGEVFPDNPQLNAALAGLTTVNLELHKKGENKYEPEGGGLVEVYVPIVFGDGPPVGVVETYKQPIRVFANIRRGQMTVLTTAIAGGATLYLCLFWIVRRAARRIESQRRALQGQTKELAEANEELRAVQYQLVASERMAAIGEVVAAVAHGIRNPLANIRASAQIALLDHGPAAASSHGNGNLIQIIGEVDRLEGRLKDLLRSVRPTERQTMPFDVNSVVRSALRASAGRIDEAGLAVNEALAPALPILMGDPALLEQVFVNLIGNAIEATAKGGSITLTTYAHSGFDGVPEVVVEVHDTGLGVAVEEVAKIFDLFYTTKAQGSGLGLAIARKFAESQGGYVSVASGIAGGATFVVTLPLRVKA